MKIEKISQKTDNHKHLRFNPWFISTVILLVIFILYFLRANGLLNISTTNTNLLNKPTPLANPKKICNRQYPYNIPEEFKRALSLRQQRLNEWKKSTNDKVEHINTDVIFNCLDIQYADLKNKEQGPEGIFIFDKESSNFEDIKIYIDATYKIKDDMLAAILLTHELAHVKQYLTEHILKKETMSCYQKEVEAFIRELEFMSWAINDEERKSLNYRIINEYGSNPTFTFLGELGNMATEYGNQCINQYDNFEKKTECFWELIQNRLTNIVSEDPYYRKQCNLN